MKVLILRFQAPLMSFGAPMIDKYGVIQPYPALSMVCGMLGNALGYHHREAEKLQALQSRLVYASRQDRRGQRIRDYQTVNLGADYMNDDLAWTTRGELEKRKGGSASSGTHIRLRDYWADAAHTVAVTLREPDQSPTLEEVAAAVAAPERPLFVGRKACLPASPIRTALIDASGLIDALRRTPLAEGSDSAPFPVWYSAENEGDGTEHHRLVTDRRDWRNQIHVGQRWLGQTEINVTTEESSHE